MKPYPCIESTLDIVIPDGSFNKILRLWIDLRQVPEVLPAFRPIVQQIKEQARKKKSPELFAWLQSIVPGLNAAQLLRKDPLDGQVTVGAMVYYVPFGEGWWNRTRRWWDSAWERYWTTPLLP